MRQYFEISGYWTDDKSEFEGYVVTNYDDCEEGVDDDSIFHYGMSEAEIISAIEEGDSENNSLDFVITSYTDITDNF
jgi:hypothetical protein